MVAVAKGSGTILPSHNKMVVVNLDIVDAKAIHLRTSTPASCYEKVAFGRRVQRGVIGIMGSLLVNLISKAQREVPEKRELSCKQAYSSLLGMGNGLHENHVQLG